MRALLIVLDSVGIGAAPDAAHYHDEHSNTLGHLFQRDPILQLPTLAQLGLARILPQCRPYIANPRASFGRMRPRSAGKDSTTGHWEIAGVILDQPFATFDRFPREITQPIEREWNIQFIGNRAASGTQIIEELGEQHIRTGNPILYTSADSVLQIAAHEKIIPVEKLYDICRSARRVADQHRIGRVIARPFITNDNPAKHRNVEISKRQDVNTNGTVSVDIATSQRCNDSIPRFIRTANRHDFSMTPPRTVLNAICERGLQVISIGKTADLFDHQGITKSFPTANNREGMRCIEELWHEIRDEPGGLLFANLVDFDTVFGHRRDPDGYASALIEFDDWLGEFLGMGIEARRHTGANGKSLLRSNASLLHRSSLRGSLPSCPLAFAPGDLLIITADHGNDPTFRGTDHTREEVPLLVFHADETIDLGCRETFADIAATLSRFFRLDEDWPAGESFPLTGDNDW